MCACVWVLFKYRNTINMPKQIAKYQMNALM